MRHVIEGMALALVCCAPALAGCQPAWAWGWLQAGVCVLGLATAVLRFAPTSPLRPITEIKSKAAGLFLIAGIGFLAWAAVCVLRGEFFNSGVTHASSRSWRALASACVLAAAFLLGCSWGHSSRKLRTVLRLLFVLAILLACVTVAQHLGWGPRRIFGWAINPQRPSGVYTNPNRFAVLLSMGWGSGLSLLLAALVARFKTNVPRGHGEPLLLALGVGVIALGIAITLSRLTFFAMTGAAGLVAAALVVRWRAIDFHARSPSPWHGLESPARTDRSGRWKASALVLFPTIGCLALGFTLGGQALGQRVNDLTQEDQADWSARWRAAKCGASLLLNEPWWGHGLGRFEAAFRLVQPLDLQKRWDALHNEPVQTGIELGLPGMALLCIAAVAWWVAWWHARPRRRRGAIGWLLTACALPVAIPQLCSLADFPLREPATGILYVFLLGVLFAALFASHPRATASAKGHGVAHFLFPFALSLLALSWAFGAWTSVRVAWAASVSPWLGRISMGEPQAQEAEGYARAVRICGEDSDLQYSLARAQLDRMQREPAASRGTLFAEWQVRLKRMRDTDPLDYRVPYLEAAGCEALNDWEGALSGMEKAVALAPAYLTLRLQAIRSRLAFGLKPLGNFDPRRYGEMQRILGHMRAVLEVFPIYEQGFVDELLQAGASADEIEPLWSGDQASQAIRRARFWLRFRRWDKAERHLNRAAGAANHEAWYGALHGRVELERGRLATGCEGWYTALSAWSDQDALARELWMAEAAHDLPLTSAQALVRTNVEGLAQSSALTVALARRLMRAKDWTHADRLLATQARFRPTALGLRCWAELALAIGDRTALESRAQGAWELSDQSPHWGRWLDLMKSRARP